MRVRPAMSFADSILQTASIARWMSDAVTASNHTHCTPPCKPPGRPGSRAAVRSLLRGDLRADAIFLLPELRRELRAEILRLEYLAELDLGPAVEGGSLQPFDRLLSGLHLPDPEAGDQLLRFGEGTVDHRALLSFEPHARTLRARMKPIPREHDARLGQLFIVLAHLGE